MSKYQCFIKGCRNEAKFREVVKDGKEVNLCKTHLLIQLRGVSQKLSRVAEKVLNDNRVHPLIHKYYSELGKKSAAKRAERITKRSAVK